MKRLLCFILVLCFAIQPLISVDASSNELAVYKYLTDALGFSISASCGIMANMKRESNFKPTAQNQCGHFGLCQWGGARKSRLIRWCRNHKYNYKSLKGQLHYLRFELKHYYPSVYKKLKSVRNNRSGAYDAGYYFCYYYEVPGSRKTSSRSRGSLTKSYFEKYAY